MKPSSIIICKIILISLLLSLAGCKKTILHVMAPLPQIENKLHHTIVWKTQIGSGTGNVYSKLSPVTNDKNIFVADRKGEVTALEINTGKKKWQKKLLNFSLHNKKDKLKISTLFSAQDKLFVGSEDGLLFALNIENGNIIWQTEIKGEIIAPAAISNDFLLIQTGNSVLHAINIETGQFLWNYNLGKIKNIETLSIRGISTPAILPYQKDVAIVGSDEGYINMIFFDKNAALLVRKTAIKNITGKSAVQRIYDIIANPIIFNNKLYAIGYNGYLVAIHPISWEILWKAELGAVNNFIGKDKMLYVVDNKSIVRALDEDNGTIIWQQDKLMYRYLTPPLFYKNNLIVGDKQGYLHWIDINTGDFVHQIKISNKPLLSTPVVQDDKIIIQNTQGKIYALSVN